MKSDRKKTLIEHVGILPIQGLLEAESWGFYRGKSISGNLNCCINAKYADNGPNVGGFLKEDVLTADILMTLTFMKPSFVAGILNELWTGDMAENEYFEVIGQSSNYFYPHYLDLPDLVAGECENVDFIRLAQPDGWIATGNALILIEAKGMRDGASFNYAQLAKEYLIAKVECERCGSEFQPRILLLVSDKIAKTLTPDYLWENLIHHWVELFDAKKDKWSESRAELMKKLISERELPVDQEKVKEIFKVLTYEKICDHAQMELKNPDCDNSERHLAQMLIDTIEWHTSGNDKSKSVNMPLWSKFFAELANSQTPLYHFYNGGIGCKLLKQYEQDFFAKCEIDKENKFRKAIEEQHQYVEQREIKLPSGKKLGFQELIGLVPGNLYCHFNKKIKKSNGNVTAEREDDVSTAKLNAEFFFGKRGEPFDVKISEIYQALNEEYQNSQARKDDQKSCDGKADPLGISKSDGLRKALKLFSRDDRDISPYQFFSYERKDFFNGKKSNIKRKYDNENRMQ